MRPEERLVLGLGAVEAHLGRTCSHPIFSQGWSDCWGGGPGAPTNNRTILHRPIFPPKKGCELELHFFFEKTETPEKNRSFRFRWGLRKPKKAT